MTPRREETADAHPRTRTPHPAWHPAQRTDLFTATFPKYKIYTLTSTYFFQTLRHPQRGKRLEGKRLEGAAALALKRQTPLLLPVAQPFPARPVLGRLFLAPLDLALSARTRDLPSHGVGLEPYSEQERQPSGILRLQVDPASLRALAILRLAQGVLLDPGRGGWCTPGSKSLGCRRRVAWFGVCRWHSLYSRLRPQPPSTDYIFWLLLQRTNIPTRLNEGSEEKKTVTK